MSEKSSANNEVLNLGVLSHCDIFRGGVDIKLLEVLSDLKFQLASQPYRRDVLATSYSRTGTSMTSSDPIP